MQTQKVRIEINKIHHIKCKVPWKFISQASRKNKISIYTIFSPVPAIVKTASESLSRPVIYFVI